MQEHPLFSCRRQRRRASSLHALVLLGFDNLAALEDLFGEAMGDEVMEAVHARVARVVRDSDTLWRAGHRQFAVSARGVDATAISAFVTRLQTAIAHDAITTSHGPVSVTVAAGCVITEESDRDKQLAAARQALGEAMASGIGCIRFAGETGAAVQRRHHLVTAAQLAMGAIRNDDLMIAYQPVVSSAGANRATFHECLVRIRDSAGNLTAAGEFMPAMEWLGLAPLIDRNVLILALDALSRQPGIRLSINIFPQTMQDAQWLMLFDEATRSDPSLAERLIIEITETAAMLDPARTRAFMDRLRRRGAAFALDDFGMGHTSFGSLRDFRFDIIKIDGAFITDIVTNPDNRFFVSKLVEIGEHFDMMTVAEFVQGAAEARVLRSLGVECFQGFYFGTPSLMLAPESTPEPVIVSSG